MIRKTLFSLLLAALLTVGQSAMAQRTVTGRVVDMQGEPIELVTVNVVGTTRAVSTNENGIYTIPAATGDTLAFHFVGFDRKTVVVGSSRNRYDVMLNENGKMRISELVVTGYSKQERRDLTGSVSSVQLDDKVSFQTVDQMLQGKAPGVYMSTSSGALGSANVLTIRGISSIMGDNNPLYVIDGVPIYGTDRDANLTNTSGGAIPATQMGGTQTGGGSLNNNVALKYSFEKNPLASLNPDDIESIEILKDAFATAIYGSRGASGVILITTKKGRSERPQVNVSYTLGLDRTMGKLDLLTGDEYAELYSNFYLGSNFPKWKNTDWLDAVTRTAVSHNASAAISGGRENTTYYLSLAYQDNESYVINNDMQRFSARLNLNTKLSRKLELGITASLAKLDNNAMQATDIYANAIKKASNLPIYDDDGNYYYGYQPNAKGYSEAYNPVAQAYINDNTTEDTRVMGNAYLEWKPLDWLTWKTEIGMDMYNSFTNVRKGELPEHITGVAGNQAQESTRMNFKPVINNTLNISKVLGEHFLQGVMGQSYEHSRERMNAVMGSNFFSPDLVGVGAAQTTRVISANAQESAIASMFARMNYQYKFRYMLGLTYRLDGSSRYNKNHRYLSTPSASLGWRMSNEPFFRRALPFVDEAKLRGSFGLSSKDGNNSYYGAQAVYALHTQTTFGGYNYLTMSQPANNNLRWERTYTWDAGLDLEMFNSRIRITLDYYYKKTTNMLFSSDLPIYTGYTKENQNIADMQNVGIDFQIISQNIVQPNFMWQTILNLSRSTNKILKLNFEGNQLDQANSSFKYYEEGKAVAQWYLHEWAGVDPETGDPLWRYKDGTLSKVPPASNDYTSQANKFVKGTAMPTFYGSLTNSFQYHDFEIDFMFTFAVGCHMMNSTRATMLTYAQESANNLSREMLNMWQLPGQKTDIPRLHNASIIGSYDYTTAITTTRFLENNSYLRLKTLTLGYNLPRWLLAKWQFVKNLKVYATLTNLLTFTGYSGLDPEVSAFGSSATAAGYDNSTMPQSRSYQFGVRASF